MGHWINNQLQDFNEQNFNLLVEHKIPGLIKKDFIAKNLCTIVAKRLEELNFQNYDHLKDIPVHQVGLCHNQWANEEPSVYFGKKEEAQNIIDKIYEGLEINPVHKVIEFLAKSCNRQVGLFEEPGYGAYFAGAFRSFKGHGKLHVDHAPSHINKPFAVTQITKQFTWNIYYSLQGEGGELVIYDTIHTPENEKQKVPGDYYFPYTVLESEDCIRIKPCVGDLIMFNTQNFHEILGNKDATRISQTSFAGLKKEGSLHLWS
jgi:hypothetical protein